MRLWLKIAILAWIFICLVAQDDFNQTREDVADKEIFKANEKLIKILDHNKKCQQQEWYCSKSCSWTNTAKVSVCNSPKNEDTCFGMKINYNYTKEHIFTSHSFPKYLELFEQFPSCWEMLISLVCSVRFRPCKMTDHLKNETIWSPIELWQLYPESTCLETQKRCKFLIDAQIWPSQLSCNQLVPSVKDDEGKKDIMKNRGIFFDDSSECKFNYDKLEFVPSFGCFSPLVEIMPDNKPKEVNALIDRCYIPCSSSFVKDPAKLVTFRLILFAFTISMGILFVCFSMYYACYFNFEKDEYIVFILKWMFASISIFFILWSYSLVTSTKSACTHGSLKNQIRRDTTSVRFDWCTIQWFSLNLLLISAFEWLTLLVYHLFIRGGTDQYKWYTKSQWNSPTNFRILLAFFVFAISFIISLIGLYSRGNLADGLTNVCYGPLEPIKSNIILYLTLFLLSFTSIGCLVRVLRKCWKTRQFDQNTVKKSYNDQQQIQALLESNQKNEKEVLILSEVNNEIDNFRSITAKSGIFITLCIVIPVVLMFFLNYKYYFNAQNERFEIDKKIKCIIEYGRELNQTNGTPDGTIPDYCMIDEIFYIDLFILFVYTLLMPSIPFICVVFAIIIGKWSKSYGLWQVYQSVTQLLNEEIENKSEEVNTGQQKSVAHVSVDMSSFASAARTEPLLPVNKRRRRKRVRLPKKRVQESRYLDLNRRKNEHVANYQPPYMTRNNLSQVNINDGISSIQNLSHQNSTQNYQQLPIEQATSMIQQCLQAGYTYLNWAAQIHQGLALNMNSNVNLDPNLLQQQFNEQPSINQVEVHAGKSLETVKEENSEVDEKVSSSDLADSDDFDSDKSDSEEERIMNGQQPKSSTVYSSESSSLEPNSSTSSLEKEEDEVLPGCSPLLHQITKHAQTVVVGRRSVFAQRVLNIFRDLFEKDDKFIEMCKVQRRSKPLNPETGTLDGNHLISVPEVIELTTNLQKNTEICQMALLLGKSIKQAKESLETRPPVLVENDD